MDKIIIHIPKTGGTTLISNLLGINRQISANFKYRHIINGKSNAGDIFEPKNVEKYKQFAIIMFIRDPFERAISEYNFVKSIDDAFLSDFQTKPANFQEYIENPLTHNSMLNFLIGGKLYAKNDEKEMEEKLRDVCECIKQLHFVICRTEDYNTSLNFLTSYFKIPENINVQRVAIHKEQVIDIENCKKLHAKYNELDYILYDALLSKFECRKKHFNKKIIDFNFTGNKYRHVIKYTEQFCILRSFNTKSDYLIKFPRELQKIHEISIKNHTDHTNENGIAYLNIWIRCFKNKFKVEFDHDEHDPLETIKYIGFLEV
jgi:hypothetical protein